MHRIDGPGATVDNKFTDGDPVGGIQATVVTDDFLNDVQEELMSVLAAGSVQPAKGTQDQLLQAIYKLLQAQKATAFVTAGSATALTLTPFPPISAYAANQRFQVKFSVASGQNPTLNVSAKGAKQLMQYDASGAKVAAVFTSGQVSDVLFDGADFLVLNPLPTSAFVDLWALQPIGVPIPVFAHLGASLTPPTDKSYRYIKLTASDSYNSGVLTSEVISGSEPLLQAVAVISFVGSPLNGKTVNLINTERRVLRASEVSGELLSDALQGHFHAQAVGEDGVNGNTPNTITTYDAGQTSGNVGMRRTNGPGLNLITIRGVITDSSNGAVRVSGETRAKSISATYYLRIK